MFAIDRLPLPALLVLAELLVAARVLRRLPSWAHTYATAERRGLKRYSLRAELGMLAAQAKWTRNSDPAWLRRVRAWHVSRRAQRVPGVVLACSLALALCGGCAEPLVHMRALGTLHTAATAQCKATSATCAASELCATGLRGAMTAWQGVSAAIAQGDDELELARTADALVSEGTTRAACLVAMPKRSK